MNRSNTKRRLSFWVLIAVVSLAGCSSEHNRTPPSPETVRNIPVLAAQQANVSDLLEAAGTVHAAQTSDAASQMMGNIVEIRAHEGEHVQRGQVLALIDDSQPRAAVDRATAADLAAEQQLAGAESDLGLAESTLKRYQTLFEKKSVSPQEFDEVKARQQAARARRDIAEAGKAQAQAALSQDTHVSGLHADSGADRYQRVSQESAASGLRDGRCGGRRRKPCVRNHEDERSDRQNQVARWLRSKAIQGHDHA
jgi:multidrug efflux pump subunit AcrA (membrane-fusion protein)